MSIKTSGRKKLAADYPIQEIWRHRKLTKYQLAEEGDVYAARHLMALYIKSVRKYKEFLPVDKLYANSWLKAELIGWIADRFSIALEESKSLDVVFGLKPGKGTGSGRRSMDSRKLQRHLDIAAAVAREMDKKATLEVACEIVAKNLTIGESAAKKAYLSYLKPVKTVKKS